MKKEQEPETEGIAVIQKTAILERSTVEAVEQAYHLPGQNFKWATYLSHLVEEDLKGRLGE